MINPVTGWFEVTQCDDKKATMITNSVETTWLYRYPCQYEIMYDCGSEFLGHEFKNTLTEEEYGIISKPDTAGHPQDKSIIKKTHQVSENLICTFDMDKHYVEEDIPWKGILEAADFDIRSTLYTANKKSLGKILFWRDMIVPIAHVANWGVIYQRNFF